MDVIIAFDEQLGCRPSPVTRETIGYLALAPAGTVRQDSPQDGGGPATVDIAVSDANANVFFYKHTAGAGTAGTAK